MAHGTAIPDLDAELAAVHEANLTEILFALAAGHIRHTRIGPLLDGDNVGLELDELAERELVTRDVEPQVTDAGYGFLAGVIA